MNDRWVAIVTRNRPEYLEALYGVWHAGLVAVPVNARLHREEFADILEHSGAALTICTAAGSRPAPHAPSCTVCGGSSPPETGYSNR